MKLQYGGMSLYCHPKRESRGGKNDSDSACQETDFIFSSLVCGRGPSSFWNCIIPHYFCPNAGLKESRKWSHQLLQTFPAPTSCTVLAGGDRMGQSLIFHHQGKGTNSQTSGLQISWYLHTPCFYLALYWNRKGTYLMFLTATKSGDFPVWDSIFKKC